MTNSSSSFQLAVQGNAITVNHVGNNVHLYKPQNLQIYFQRTIRVPDNLGTSQLPPGLGDFPLYQVKDYASRLPADMVARGGVFLPMYQKEALWIRLRATVPFMIKIYAGGVNAVSGEHRAEGDAARKRRADRLAAGESIQDYVVACGQLWVDGFAVAPGVVRQFVAMPVGQGYSAEAQLAGEETVGGLQFEITPVKPEIAPPPPPPPSGACSLSSKRSWRRAPTLDDRGWSSSAQVAPMGIAPGGRIRQCIVADTVDPARWVRDATLTVPVQILNSAGFRAVTGRPPPPCPIGARVYADAGLPFFDLDESGYGAGAVGGLFAGMSSVNKIEQARGIAPDFEPDVAPARLVRLDGRGRRVHVDLAKISDPQGLLSPAGPHREFRALDDLEREVAGGSGAESDAEDQRSSTMSQASSPTFQ
ncbi:hypothetical protein F5X99DRAFT_406474 [Biscogniauxia marginata]|nr:hypothetical protein F5X99DRAFT_406474 [Biscogniauxia marginata]